MSADAIGQIPTARWAQLDPASDRLYGELSQTEVPDACAGASSRRSPYTRRSDVPDGRRRGECVPRDSAPEVVCSRDAWADLARTRGCDQARSRECSSGRSMVVPSLTFCGELASRLPGAILANATNPAERRSLARREWMKLSSTNYTMSLKETLLRERELVERGLPRSVGADQLTGRMASGDEQRARATTIVAGPLSGLGLTMLRIRS